MHNPAFFEYSKQARFSPQRSTVRMQPPRLVIPAILLLNKSRAFIINAVSLLFKPCNGNVEDIRDSQGNGVITTTTHLITTNIDLKLTQHELHHMYHMGTGSRHVDAIMNLSYTPTILSLQFMPTITQHNQMP